MTPRTASQTVDTTFITFLERTLGIRLSPGQRVLWSVIADGVQPGTLEGESREIARRLFGDVDEIPPELLAVIAIVKGGRIGGTYFAALRLLHLALVAPLRLAPGEHAFGVIVAPDLRLARQALRFVSGAIDGSKPLRQREVKRSDDAITIRRDDGQHVTIECLPATRGGSALRGRTLVGALLDEAAFFRDESAVVNDAEVYRAVAPRVVPGGQLLVSSTPWAEGGLLYDLFSKNYGVPTSCVAVLAPTLVMRGDDKAIVKMVRRETERDPDNAAREYGAEFMTRGSGLFFDSAAISAAIDSTLHLPVTLRPTANHRRLSAAVDPGFSRDSSTFVAIACEDGVYTTILIDELRPQKGAPLSPTETVGRWAELAKGLGISTLRSDIHYRETVREVLSSHSITLEPVPEGQTGKRAMYEKARTLLNDGRVRLPNHPRLLRQLREVISKPTSGGGMTISSPRKNGDHGDLVSAFVAALYDADEGSSIEMWCRAAEAAW